MKTDFFQQIAALNLKGNLLISIQPKENLLVVSVLLKNDEVKDEAVSKIPPLTMTASAAEFDAEFFGTISRPIQRTNQLFCNLLDYEKAQEKAYKENRIEKNKQTEQRKTKDANRKKFDDQMKKVTDLESQKKYGEAIGQMPDLKTFPEFTMEINHKMWELRKLHGTLDLFEQEEPPAPVKSNDIEDSEKAPAEPFDDNGEPEEEEEEEDTE
jgi:PRTRC genetic system protein E